MFALLLFAACFPRLEGEAPADDPRRPDEVDADTDADSDTDTDADSDTDSDTDTDTDTDTDVDTCWDDDVSDALGASVATGTASGNDGAGSCGGSSSADSIVRWTAPATDTFIFDTVGSDSDGDTTLWVVSDDCDGDELACNDDTFGADSQVSVSLTRGDVVMVGVEATGRWVLNAWQGDCPEYTIGSELSLTGSTASSTTDYEASCETVTKAVTLRWIAPASGTYTFATTEDSDFDTILALFEGTCDGAEIDCNDDADSENYGPSSITTWLTAGDVVAIVLGGYGDDSGTYYLDITQG